MLKYKGHINQNITDINTLSKIFKSPVSYTLLTKLWSIVSGPFTAYVIAIKFSEVLQGFYFTFNSLLSIQIFVELGLTVVIQYFCSHEWAKLNLKEGVLVGEKEALSKLSDVAKIAFKWFFYSGIIAFFVFTLVGLLFFSNQNPEITSNVIWQKPWMFLSLSTSLIIIFTPTWAILEGCNQIKNVYLGRLIQGFFFTSTLIFSILLGLELWAPFLASFAGFISSMIFIFYKYHRLLIQILFKVNNKNIITWKKDILPMQWKIAVSWISNFLSFYLFTPILFAFQGPEIAGKFGMSWTILLAIGSFSSSWMIANTPKYSILISENKYQELENLNRKMMKITFAVMTFLCMILIFSKMIFLNTDFLNLNIFFSRILDIEDLLFLCIGQIMFFVASPINVYIRSHKKEPLMIYNLFLGFSISISIFLMAKFYSQFEILIVYALLSVIAFIVLVVIWERFKKNQINYFKL